MTQHRATEPSPRRRFIVAGGVGVAVLLGLALAFAVWYVRNPGGAASPPSESAEPSPTLTATAATPEPSPEPSPRPTATPTATPEPIPSADPAVAELVFSVTPWNDIISPLTTSLAADGRLTTTRVGMPEGGERPLELRRLSDRGIDLVRQEILATGLFAESAGYWPIPLPGHEPPGRGVSGYTVELGTDAGSVRVRWSLVEPDEVDWAQPSPERARLDELGPRLTSLDAWLPADAWVDQAPRPYVPGRYRLFTVAQTWGGAVADLPADVTGIAWPLGGSLLTFGEPQPNSVPDYLVRCAVLSADDAERAMEALSAAGAPLSTPLGERYVTGTDLGDRATTRVVGVTLVALHPHETSCTDAYPPAIW